MNNIKDLLVLLVEDNNAHAELVIRSFRDNNFASAIRHVTDGEMALDYLMRRGAFSNPEDSPRPHVILLDLRIPKVDGIEVLKEIRAADQLKNIPVIVLTTSDRNSDIVQAYENHVNSYVVKPLNFHLFTELMRDLGVYWLGWNTSSENA